MKEKVKYNFLHIIPLHYSKFYDFFLQCCAQGRRLFVIPSDQTGASENHFVKGDKNLKKGTLFFKKVFAELHFISQQFSAQNLVTGK